MNKALGQLIFLTFLVLAVSSAQSRYLTIIPSQRNLHNEDADADDDGFTIKAGVLLLAIFGCMCACKICTLRLPSKKKSNSPRTKMCLSLQVLKKSLQKMMKGKR